jgi:hypothetical protein
MGTDGAWRWREGVEDKYHYRFWGQVVRWMAYQRSMAEGTLMRLFYSPERPQIAESVRLHANVAAVDGEPLQDGTVFVHVVAPSGQSQSVRLIPQGDEWGLFSNSFTPDERGKYRLTLECQENDSTLETTLDVQGTVREKIGRPARFDVLREITQLTNGRLVRTGEITTMFEQIAQLPEPTRDLRRFRLWCHPVWVAIVILLLALFWISRKMMGTV